LLAAKGFLGSYVENGYSVRLLLFISISLTHYYEIASMENQVIPAIENFDCIGNYLIDETNNGNYYQLPRINFEVLVLRKELIPIHCVVSVNLFILVLYYSMRYDLYYWYQKDLMLEKLRFYSSEMYSSV
jgi:hypothetical protein